MAENEREHFDQLLEMLNQRAKESQTRINESLAAATKALKEAQTLVRTTLNACESAERHLTANMSRVAAQFDKEKVEHIEVDQLEHRPSSSQ